MTFTNYFDSFTGYFLRQEGRSIRFYNDLIGSDSLLVSYEYQVGDTVRGDIFYPCGFSQNTIQRVDSVLINSEYRKVFYIDSISGPVITEGIGHQLSTYSEGEFIKPLCEGGFGTGTSIFCYGLGETPYWSSENETGNCSVMVGLESINSVDFKIYPNPFVAETTLEFDNSMIGAHIIVVDLQGQVVKQLRTVNAQRIVIHRDDLPAGLYFIRLTKDSGVTKTMKIAIID